MLHSGAVELGITLPGATPPRSARDFSPLPLLPATKQTNVGRAGSVHEQEAERVSEQVMQMPEPQLDRNRGGTVSAKSGALGQIAVPPQVGEVLSSPGQPLDTASLARMGDHFGHDFSSVRVHTGPLAARSAESVAAQAYTVGSDIVFGAGRYDPATRTGQRLLAHELTHVVQQSGAAQDVVSSGQFGPKVSARTPVSLAAQPDPSMTGSWFEPIEIQPDPDLDKSLGLQIVDPSEIEAKIRRFLSVPGSGPAYGQSKTDFRSNPRIAKANLEHSHWPDDHARLSYARGYFEQFLGSAGDAVESETLVQAMVNYEVQVQSQAADLVVHHPLTPEERAKLRQLRKQRSVQAQQRASFEGPLAKARAEFVSNQQSSFGHTDQLLWQNEIDKVADSVILAARDVSNSIPLAFFEYYSDHMILKMSSSDEKKAEKNDTFALTDPHDDTRLRWDLTSFPEEKLGPILLHELGHTHDVSSGMGLGDFQEGHGYAVEYFLSKDKDRRDGIVTLLSGDAVLSHSQKKPGQNLFSVTLATLIALSEVIQHGSSPHLTPDLTPDAAAAKILIAERVERSQPDSDELAAITEYVKRHLDTFDMPRFY